MSIYIHGIGKKEIFCTTDVRGSLALALANVATGHNQPPPKTDQIGQVNIPTKTSFFETFTSVARFGLTAKLVVDPQWSTMI